MIYIVLGMHKSGTTLISQMLHASGINMDEDVDVTRDYDQGILYERPSIVALNHSLLRGRMFPPVFQSLKRGTTAYAEGLYHSSSIAWRLPFALDDCHRRALLQIVDDCDQRWGDWGLKDPRLCLTYPIIQPELPPHRLIIVFRPITELLKRYRCTGWDQFHVFRLYRVLHAWTRYNQNILSVIRCSKAPSIVINYQSLMTDPTHGGGEFDRLCRFVDRPLIDTRSPEKYRNRSLPASQDLPFLARTLLPFLPANPQRIYLALDNARTRKKQEPD